MLLKNIIDTIRESFFYQKIIAYTFCVIFITIICPIMLSANNTFEDKGNRIAKMTENLVQHQWFLRQIIETKGDSVNNVTLFLTPCEKDNFTKYAVNETYVIHEGETRCSASDKEIKGDGTWEWEEEGKLIVETYLGGRPMEKTVIELSETIFKVRYQSAGGKYTELTYLSPKAFEDEVLMATIEDPANQAQNLTNIAKSVLRDKGRYQVLGMEHLRNRELLEGTKKSKVHKRVLVYPFTDNTNNDPLINYTALNKELYRLGNELEIDYILTGELLMAESNKTKKGKEKGHVRYNIRVLDVALGATKDQERMEVDMKRLTNLKPAVTAGAVLLAYFGSTRYWRGYYSFYFVNHLTWSAYQVDRLYSTIDPKVRESYMKKNEAINEAFKQTVKKMDKFVNNNLPLTLPIHSVLETKKGEAKTLKVRGGSNCSLEENAMLEVVTLGKEDIGEGQIIENKTTIAWLKVIEVENNFLSRCKVVRGGDRLLQEMEAKNPDLVVLTTDRKNFPPSMKDSGIPFNYSRLEKMNREISQNNNKKTFLEIGYLKEEKDSVYFREIIGDTIKIINKRGEDVTLSYCLRILSSDYIDFNKKEEYKSILLTNYSSDASTQIYGTNGTLLDYLTLDEFLTRMQFVEYGSIDKFNVKAESDSLLVLRFKRS